MSENRIKFKCPICNEWHEIGQRKYCCLARCHKIGADKFLLSRQTLDELLFTLDLLDIDRAYCDDIVWGKNPHTLETKYISARMFVSDEFITLYNIDIVNDKYLAYFLDNEGELDWANIGKFNTLAEAKKACQKHFDNLKKGER
jgi:hypothetical protein